MSYISYQRTIRYLLYLQVIQLTHTVANNNKFIVSNTRRRRYFFYLRSSPNCPILTNIIFSPSKPIFNSYTPLSIRYFDMLMRGRGEGGNQICFHSRSVDHLVNIQTHLSLYFFEQIYVCSSFYFIENIFLLLMPVEQILKVLKHLTQQN